MAPRKDADARNARIAKQLKAAGQRRDAAHAEAIRENNRRSVLAALARWVRR